MTTDERIDKLTERHEALTQSVEALLLAQQETDKRLDHMIEGIELLTTTAVQHSNDQLRLFRRLSRFEEAALRIAADHSQRILNIEDELRPEKNDDDTTQNGDTQ
jgi:hypothetical protein